MAIIEVDGLTKRYGRRTILDGVDLAVEPGEIFGILGPNGAGKTTTVECIEGLRTPDSGRIRVDGLDPARDERQLRQILGVQLQESELPPKLRVGEALALYSSFYGDPVDWRELVAGLRLSDRLGTPFRRLSGGQKQRVSVALALVGRPKVVVLDELTTGLDPQSRRDVRGLIEGIRERGVTVLLVSHFMEEAERLCDRLAVIDRGRVVASGTPSALISRVGAPQRLRFRTSRPFALEILRALPDVASVEEWGGHVRVTGADGILHRVTAALADAGVQAEELSVGRATLDDAFLALTGRSPSEGSES
ncbi:ABC transporter ATP-binding protein [Microbacterium album]|nr:ABC transporter ATP-binding protein [Microbacterium album]